ncbi:MnhB domain-containing protein [Microbulbifer magnicolonia]|uniref:MnhB domain-containing protein n=1 Tax=Microbulbifer magnicolonia TaxID=3109744 RepID=UPI002B402420|nr:MnhB domain-containing protein [Microbulbifer sp. GG15]
MNSPILQGATRILAALILLFSVYMLLRGHNEPGGGFIAGLIASAALILFALAWGVAEARASLRVAPAKLAAAGGLLAGGSGAVALLSGLAPFTGLWLFIGGGDDGKGLPVSTVLAFDIGVYLAVFGSVLMLFFALEDD